MGLSASSTGTKLLNSDILEYEEKCDFTITLAGNPNVGKSTIFNALTGLHQHTGNWPGKTVSNASGITNFKDKNFLLIDIPGTYSIMSNSEEEEIARDYICFGKSDATVVVVDATCLERNLNLVYQILEITPNVVVCVNLIDEAKKKGIYIDIQNLEKSLGVPVVSTIAKKEKTLKNLMETVYMVCNKSKKCNPKTATYVPVLENCIELLYKYLVSIIPNDKQYMTKWICLKIIEGNTKILNSIENNLNINICDNSEINRILDEISSLLSNADIGDSDISQSIISSIMSNAENTSTNCVSYDKDSNKRAHNIDKILTSKKYGIPIMIVFLGVIFWITITGANYPSQVLSDFFLFLQGKLFDGLVFLHFPSWLISLLVDGIFRTVSWIVSVMLPPMAIFFPLFTLLEDLGYLPRIAFNLDNYFRKACTSGKQALTMCMGFGCNAAGVVGSRIIDSPREKLISIITNAFVPCNGRFPFLITIATIFIGSYFTGILSSVVASITVLAVILLGIYLTLVMSKFLSKTLLKGVPSSFVLELPPYRKPQILQILVRSLLDRTLFVLGRSLCVALPAGIIIWLFANIHIADISILDYIANFLQPFGKILGLDGYIITAFLLGLPANEIVLPIILMSYTQAGVLVNLENLFEIKTILIQNGWTIITAINVMIFTLLHFPCGTTLLTIKKETGSLKWTIVSFLLPTLCGIVICFVTNLIYNLVV